MHGSTSLPLEKPRRSAAGAAQPVPASVPVGAGGLHVDRHPSGREAWSGNEAVDHRASQESPQIPLGGIGHSVNTRVSLRGHGFDQQPPGFPLWFSSFFSLTISVTVGF